MPRGGGPEKASFEQETNTPYHPTAATRAAGPLGQAGAQGLCGSRPESSHRQARLGHAEPPACAPSKHQCSPEAQEASRSSVPPKGPGSIQIVPPTQRPRKRPDPVSHPEAQEASRSSVPQRPRKCPDPRGLWTHDECMDRGNLDLSLKQADKPAPEVLGQVATTTRSPRVRGPLRCTLVLSGWEA